MTISAMPPHNTSKSSVRSASQGRKASAVGLTAISMKSVPASVHEATISCLPSGSVMRRTTVSCVAGGKLRGSFSSALP